MVVVTPSQPPATVYALLQKAKPSWSAKDLQRVYQKLQKVAITDSESLARSISEGSLNPTLAAAGERKLKSSTLAFLRLAVRDPVRTPKESVDERNARQQAMQSQLPSLTSSPGPALLMPSKRPSLPAAVVLPPLMRPSQPSHRSWRSRAHRSRAWAPVNTPTVSPRLQRLSPSCWTTSFGAHQGLRRSFPRRRRRSTTSSPSSCPNDGQMTSLCFRPQAHRGLARHKNGQRNPRRIVEPLPMFHRRRMIKG